MLTALSLEYIGEDGDAYARQANRLARSAGYELGVKLNRPWVALITGRDTTYTYARKFQQAQIDYSRANSLGSRGVYLHFWLSDGIYEVMEHLSWKRSRRYFLQVTNGEKAEITQEQVEAFLNQQEKAERKEE